MRRALLDHRLVFVLGKGGVGRTTLTAALGRAAGLRSQRACVAELGSSAALPPRFGLPGRSFAFRRGWSASGSPSGPGVDVWSLTVPECLEDFGSRKLGLPGFARRMLRNRFMMSFVDAVPGLHDLLLLGKVENLIREPRRDDPRFDTMFVDAPATGHGLTLLTAARTMTSITKTGPFYDLARTIEEFVEDASMTALVLVTLAEALPVSETLELASALIKEGFTPHSVIVNRVTPPPWVEEVPRSGVTEILQEVPHGPALADLVALAWARHDQQTEAIRTLTEGLAAQNLPPPLIAPLAGRSPDAELAPILAEAL